MAAQEVRDALYVWMPELPVHRRRDERGILVGQAVLGKPHQIYRRVMHQLAHQLDDEICPEVEDVMNERRLVVQGFKEPFLS